MAALRPQDKMNPAERFEDEKRRIIESCFSKREDDGSVSESYITHIRIKEDAAYPSSPPPPDSPPDNKKDRVIIVAVRKAGRVRMHKARENTSGTFSIGKTWMLDHLSAIESYTGLQPKTAEEAQQKQWAGDTGVLITIQKPYFWKATSSKEKDFFIGSLIKIHRKYAGRDPQLSGFTAQEMASFTGAPPGSRQPPMRPPIPPDASQRPTPSPGFGPPGGMSMGRPPGAGPPGAGPPPQPPPPPIGRERFYSSSSVGSSRPDSQRRDMPGGFPEEPDPLRPQELRNRLNQQVRNPSPSNRSIDSYGGSTVYSERDRRQESHSSLESSQTRLPLTPGRGSNADRFPPNGMPLPPPVSRGGTPGPPPVPNPRSPDRRGPPQLPPGPPGLPPPGAIPPIPLSGSPAPRANRSDSGAPPERRRPPIMNVPSSSGENGRAPEDPPLRNNMRLRNESNASNLSKGSGSDVPGSRPSTAGRQGSPHRPPGLNLSQNTRQRDDHLQPFPKADIGDGPVSATSGPVDVPDAIPTLPDSAGAKKPADMPSSPDGPREQQSGEAPALAPARSIGDMFKQLDIASPTESNAPQTPASPEETFRPGLGPMIKKKQTSTEVANKFRMVAAAASAFKPRAKGAGERMRLNLEKQSDGADGITGVFKPPMSPLPKAAAESEKKTDTPTSPLASTNLTTASAPKPAVEPGEAKDTTASPKKLQVESSVQAKEAAEPDKEPEQPKAEESKSRQPTQEEARKKQLSNHAAKYAKTLGINPALLEGRTTEIEAIFDDIGWADGKPLTRSFGDLQAEIKRELSRVETGSWLDAFEGTDDRVVAVSTMLDKTIAECEELDGLLTLYNVELGTLNEDIQFIEAQSQGLQVQTANQRQLHLELNNLLKTISIPSSKLTALQDESLSKADGLSIVEDALSELYKALVTIDPNLSSLERPSLAEQNAKKGALEGGIGNMQAVQDKRSTYLREANGFVLRLRHFLETKYKEAESQSIAALERNRNTLPSGVKLDLEAWHNGRKVLWMYSPIMLFARNIVPAEWEELIAMYGNTVKSTYRSELRKSIDAWKLMARRPTGQEQDALFTTPQEKEPEGMARKLTVKRSKTLREGPRVAPGDRTKQEGKIPAYQAFYSALLEVCKAIFMEQNFVIKLFHATMTDTSEFPDLVSSTQPADRQGDQSLTDAGVPEFGGPYGPRVKQQVANIFYSFSTDLQGLVDIVVDQNPLHMVGVMYAIEDNRDKTQHSNQDFLLEHLNRVHDDLERRYVRFIDEQMTAIDATKVKISKRKGVIPFMKVFPLFAAAIEDQLPSPAADESEIRGKVDADYQKIYRAMSKALIEVGNKDQDAGVTGGDEEKEQLNHHILLIENHNHYLEEVDPRNNPALLQGREESERTMAQHMADYIDSVVRRPLGPLLNTIESAEAAIGAAEADGQPPSSIATLASHRANTFRKNVGAFDAKEIRKGVELLRKRVEKHFGDADDERISSRLVEKVTHECEARYADVQERLVRIVRDVYEGQVEIELRKEDFVQAFQK